MEHFVDFLIRYGLNVHIQISYWIWPTGSEFTTEPNSESTSNVESILESESALESESTWESQFSPEKGISTVYGYGHIYKKS